MADQPDIKTNQNLDQNLIYQQAAYYHYDKSNKYFICRMIFVSLTVFLFILNKNHEFGAISVFVNPIISVLYVLLGYLGHKARFRAASYKECFDTNVFQMLKNEFFGIDLPNDKLVIHARKSKRNPDYFHDWYEYNSTDSHAKDILKCQQINIIYTKRLLLCSIIIVLAVLLLLLVMFIVDSIIQKLEISGFLLLVFLPMLALTISLMIELVKEYEIKVKLEKLDTAINNIKKSVSKISDDELIKTTRDIQDIIFYIRFSIPFIESTICYRILEDKIKSDIKILDNNFYGEKV